MILQLNRNNVIININKTMEIVVGWFFLTILSFLFFIKVAFIAALIWHPGAILAITAIVFMVALVNTKASVDRDREELHR